MNTFTWGLAGYGDLADKRGAAALQTSPGCSLRGVWGRNEARARQFASRHDIGEAHSSLEALLESGIDALYVCTPPDSHLDYALAALERGIHVLVEKPMAATKEECGRMLDTATASGATLGVAYYRRAFPKMRRVKEFIEAGVLGVPTWVNIAAHSWFAPAQSDPKYWRVQQTRSGGGGAVADIGVHRLDLLDYWLGPAQLQWRSLTHLVHDYDVEDSSSAVLCLQNGAPVHTYFAWNSRTWADRFEIVGSEGKLIIDPLDGPGLTIVRGREREELHIEAPANAHAPCVDDFVEAAQAGRAPLCDGEAGLRTSSLLQQILS